MGLADLKKNSTQSKRSNAGEQLPMSLNDFIDDFIDDATHYASGKPEQARQLAQVIALETGFDGILNRTIPSIKSQPRKVFPRGDSPYRKATFTLSESAIAHLAELASGCDVAKSKLIRFLIEHHYSLDESERLEKERSILVD
ncbi:CopG family transcriptional regulator [Shewanella sp. Isolate11]|uniref:CopG family transcriptional regulator n=1 Tax=Shewanella sp. Isolate11 TaxID=2908530 RepID=UPI001EFDAB88|nr:CopG family transcriptional regulator [Shewanella sp. Isolate11]MCG9697221.1 CopG family transcriptional regulator [Shewanella sp. Isolate11]